MEKNNKTNKEKRKYTRRKPMTASQLKNIRKISRIQTAEEAQIRIDELFKYCEKKKIPPTVARLAHALGFNSRNTLLEYEKTEKHKDIEEEEKILIADTIKKAKLRIEIYLEENLIEGKQVAGTIFNLKNNFGYIDRTEQEHKGELIVQIEGIDKF